MHLPLVVTDTTSTLSRPPLLTSTHSRLITTWVTRVWPETSISSNNNIWGEPIMITCRLNIMRCRLFSNRIRVINLSIVVLINFLNITKMLTLPLVEAGPVAMSIKEWRILMQLRLSDKGLRFTHSSKHLVVSDKVHQVTHILTYQAEFKIITKQ